MILIIITLSYQSDPDPDPKAVIADPKAVIPDHTLLQTFDPSSHTPCYYPDTKRNLFQNTEVT